MGVQLLVILLLTLLNGFFSMSEIALVSLNDNMIKVKAEKGDRKSVTLYRLLQNSNQFLSTIQIGITLAGFLSSAFASDAFADELIALILRTFPTGNAAVLKPVAMVVVTLILSYFTIVLGEMLPKRIGMAAPERISYAVAGFINLVSKIMAPVVALLSVSTNAVVWLLRIDSDKNRENVTEEEIRIMVDVGQEEGTIQENEKVLIHNVFNFDKHPATDIMTHRTDIVAFDVQTPYGELRRTAFTERYSRYPVYEGSIDNIVGIVHLKDLLASEDEVGPGFDVRNVMREAYFVPETVYNDKLLYNMQKNKAHMAILIDEYGGTAGLITMEDLLEEIVGDIYDEHDEYEPKEIETLGEDEYLIAGNLSLDQVENLVYIGLPLDDYRTLSGFVVGELGHLPEPGDRGFTFTFGGYGFEIVEVADMVIEKVRMYKLPKGPEDED